MQGSKQKTVVKLLPVSCYGNFGCPFDSRMIIQSSVDDKLGDDTGLWD